MIRPEHYGHMFQLQNPSPMTPATAIIQQLRPSITYFTKVPVLFDIRDEHHYSSLRFPLMVHQIVVDMTGLSVTNTYDKLLPMYTQTYMAAKHCGAKNLWLTMVDFPLPIVIHVINVVHGKYGHGLNVRLFDSSNYCMNGLGRIVLTLDGLDKFQVTCPNVQLQELLSIAPTVIIQ